jgi:hypothetical protein
MLIHDPTGMMRLAWFATIGNNAVQPIDLIVLGFGILFSYSSPQT